MNTKTSEPSFARIIGLYWAFAPTFMVRAGVKTGLFDALQDGARTLEELKQKTKSSERGLRTLANGLVGQNLLTRDSQGRYGLTPDSATYLVSSKPDTFWGPIFEGIDAEILMQWEPLHESVRSGKPKIAHNQEENTADYFAEAVYSIMPMSWPGSVALSKHLAKALEKTPGPLTAVDVASGSGVWGVPLAMNIPGIRVTAIDFDEVLKVTRRTAERHGVADRMEFKPGNIDDIDFGTGRQVAVLGHILHAVGEARSRVLLERAFAALAPGGTVVVPEFIMNEDGCGPDTSIYFAMGMLVTSEDGGAFSFKEISSWLTEAGFTNVRLLEAPAASPLILATKPA